MGEVYIMHNFFCGGGGVKKKSENYNSWTNVTSSVPGFWWTIKMHHLHFTFKREIYFSLFYWTSSLSSLLTWWEQFSSFPALQCSLTLHFSSYPHPSHPSSCRLHFQHRSFFSHGDAWREHTVYIWDTSLFPIHKTKDKLWIGFKWWVSNLCRNSCSMIMWKYIHRPLY